MQAIVCPTLSSAGLALTHTPRALVVCADDSVGVAVAKRLTKLAPRSRGIQLVPEGTTGFPSSAMTTLVNTSSANGATLALAILGAIEDGSMRVSTSSRVDLLTDREHEILRELSLGLAAKQIASRLHISRYTVDNHTRAIFRKFGVSNKTEALREAHRRQLLGW